MSEETNINIVYTHIVHNIATVLDKYFLLIVYVKPFINLFAVPR